MNDKELQIIEAAIKLLAQEGIGVPTARIAKEAGVSNGTLFNYFETKQALIDAVYLYIKARAAKEIVSDVDIKMDVKEILFRVWSAYVYWAQKNYSEDRVVALLFSSQMLSSETLEKGEALFSKIFEVARKAVVDNILTPDLPHDLISEIARGQMQATVCYISREKIKKAEVDKIIRSSFQIFWGGVSV